jgi:hypothetical protein
MKTQNNCKLEGMRLLKMVGFIFVMLFSLNNCWSDNSSSHNDTAKAESYTIQSNQIENGNEVQNEDQIQPENAPFYQIENNIDSIIVNYWNAVDSDYDSYNISYSFVSKKMVVFVEYLKNHPVYYIDSIEHINLFLASIDDFYLKKTVSIIEKKTKYDRDEHVEYDIPTFTISCYKNGKQVLLSNTPLEDGYYELIFNPKFEEFKSMLFSIINEFDKYVEQLPDVKGPARNR